jgi:hypothetical protein
MEGLIFHVEFGVKRSSALDIEVDIIAFRDPGSVILSNRDTISHLWTTHERKSIHRFYFALSLSTQERHNLYLLPPSRVWGKGEGGRVS